MWRIRALIFQIQETILEKQKNYGICRFLLRQHLTFWISPHL